MSVTPEYLVQGAMFALEQCGLLLRDATILYQSFSPRLREELGRSSILFDLRKRAVAGDDITLDQIREACNDHLTKQRKAMLSFTMAADRDTGLV
jgi:hypothetical protein